MESRLYQWAQDTGRFRLKNTVKPTRSKISEADEAEMEEFLKYVRLLTTILGHKVFEPVAQAQNKPINASNTLYLKARGIQATGEVTSEGFVVHKGSQSTKDCVPSCASWVANFREKLQSESILSEQDEYFVYEKDFLFATPSGAACVTLGRNTNGWQQWKNTDGQTLKALEEQQ